MTLRDFEHGLPGTSTRLLDRSSRLLVYILSVSRRRSLFTSLFLLLGSISEGLSLALLFPVLQLMSRQGPGTHLTIPATHFLSGRDAPVQIDLAVILVAFVILVSLSALFNRFKSIYMAELLLETINRLRVELFRSVALARWSAIARMRTADLDHLLTGDIDRVQSAIAAMFLLSQNLVLLCIYIGLSSLISLKMTAFATLIGGIIFVALRSIRRKSAALGDKLTYERQRQYRTISDFLAGLKMIKSFNCEERYLRQLADALSTMRAQLIGYVKMTSLGSGVSQSLIVALGCLFIYLSYAVYAVPFAKIIVMLIIFTRISPRFRDVQDQYQIILVNLSAFEAMKAKKEECDAEREGEYLPGTGVKFSLTRDMIFDEVCFSYGEAQVLKRVSFSIPAGRITALVGPSGSGKTTLADLAMGLQFPASGSIRVDGTVLTEDTHKAWRAYVAYVPQDSFMLSGSIKDNVCLGMVAPDSEQVETALRQAQASAFVSNLPAGLDTIVGDGGLQLSGGERQRIALARALLRRPSLLILDEPTSALDRDNTDQVIEALRALRGACTVLIITHNAAVVRSADQIVELSQGAVSVISDHSPEAPQP